MSFEQGSVLVSVATTTSDAWADVHRSLSCSDEGGPLGEACVGLRALNSAYPRMYAVASMANEAKRRWWQLAVGLENGRAEQMVTRSLEDVKTPEVAAIQVATALIHAIVGRVVALLVLQGRTWDPGIDNLWIHMDSDGGIDWAGLTSPVLRVLPGDSLDGASGTVTLPCEKALLIWTAHRCLTSLDVVSRAIADTAPLDPRVFWSLVGDAVLGASTHVPMLSRSLGVSSARRGQALLDAFVAAGVPVRSRPASIGRLRLRAS